MKARVIDSVYDLQHHQDMLKLVIDPEPKSRPGELLFKVSACRICHTGTDEIEGRYSPAFISCYTRAPGIWRVEEKRGNINKPGERLREQRSWFVLGSIMDN